MAGSLLSLPSGAATERLQQKMGVWEERGQGLYSPVLGLRLDPVTQFESSEGGRSDTM